MVSNILHIKYYIIVHASIIHKLINFIFAENCKVDRKIIRWKIRRRIANKLIVGDSQKISQSKIIR